MNSPLVSVVIPFYSGLDWLVEALKSVEDQTYKNIEVLVINDGSKENLLSLEDKFNLRISVINKENGGPASARNLGIDKSKGKYVAFLDSDDVWLPEKLAKQIDYMENNQCVWSQHSYEMFWNEGSKTKIINTRAYNGEVLRDCYISFRVQTSCFVVLREFLNNHTIRFPEEKRYGEDGEFYRKIAKLASLCYVEGVLSRFRIRGSNAGFKAEIQIHDKADTWISIKNDNEILRSLPKPIVFAYKLSTIASNQIKNNSKFFRRNEKISEYIAKIVYTFPYLLFRAYARKTNEPN